jgi:hypothetical protein
MKELPLPRTRYVGIDDVVAELIDRSRRPHGGPRLTDG